MNFDDDWQTQFDSWPNFLKAKSQRCHEIAWDYFESTGDIPIDSNETWCLHHIDQTLLYFDPSRYASWNIEDLMPMTLSQHTKLHQDFKKRNQEYGFLDKMMVDAMNAYCKANRHH